MNMASTIEDLRVMSKKHINNNFNKAELVEMILAAPQAPQAGHEVILQRIDKLSNDMNSRIDNLKLDLTVMIDQKNKALRNEVDDLKAVVSQQQRFLEQIDSKLRGQNLVVMGIPERDNVGEATNDKDKIAKVLDTIGADGGTYSIRRLGVEAADRNRPILISVDTAERREMIIGKAPTLSKVQSMKSFRIKRDTHPAIRKEWGRLFEAERAEKAKPENTGVKIEFDKKKRQIMREGVVIDSWKTLNFL